MSTHILRNFRFVALLAAIIPWAVAYGDDNLPSLTGFSHCTASPDAGFATVTGADSNSSNFRLVDYAPCVPDQVTCPQGQGSTGTGAPGSSTANPSNPSSSPNTSLFTGEQIGGTGGGEVTIADGQYIDSAIINNMVRFRTDAAFDDEAPDRAEFIYAKCGCFGGDARGPGNAPEQKINYQELSAYVELIVCDRFSSFVELPVRFIQFQSNSQLDGGGLGDVNFGCKYAIINEADQCLTSQVRVYTPTGDSYLGYGTGHPSVEPALLYWRRLTDRLTFQAEFRDWIPLGGSDFAGNVIRYGFGGGYDLVKADDPMLGGKRLTAVFEMVGWDVLNGSETTLDGPSFFASARDTTIINLKIGPRLTWGNNSLYASWGHCVTEQAWYRDIARIGFERTF